MSTKAFAHRKNPHRYKRFLNVPVYRAGDYNETHGYESTPDDVREMANTYDPEWLEAPVTIDHEQTGAAVGWIDALKDDGNGLLLADMSLNYSFCHALEMFPYRSIEIMMNHPLKDGRRGWYVRAVSVLGAASPSVTGMGRTEDFASADDELPGSDSILYYSTKMATIKHSIAENDFQPGGASTAKTTEESTMERNTEGAQAGSQATTSAPVTASATQANTTTATADSTQASENIEHRAPSAAPNSTTSTLPTDSTALHAELSRRIDHLSTQLAQSQAALAEQTRAFAAMQAQVVQDRLQADFDHAFSAAVAGHRVLPGERDNWHAAYTGAASNEGRTAILSLMASAPAVHSQLYQNAIADQANAAAANQSKARYNPAAADFEAEGLALHNAAMAIIGADPTVTYAEALLKASK